MGEVKERGGGNGACMGNRKEGTGNLGRIGGEGYGYSTDWFGRWLAMVWRFGGGRREKVWKNYKRDF